MGRLLRIALVLSGPGTLLSACVTPAPADRFGGNVIERSKQEPPAWIALQPGVLHESDGVFKYVEVQTKLPDLPIGVKRTQTDAIVASRIALKERVRELVRSYASERSFAIIGPLGELDQQLLEATNEVHGEFGKVADVYFEKLSADAAVAGLDVFYTTYVLIHFPEARMKDLLREVATRLSRSRDSSLRELSAIVRSMAAESVTH